MVAGFSLLGRRLLLFGAGGTGGDHRRAFERSAQPEGHSWQGHDGLRRGYRLAQVKQSRRLIALHALQQADYSFYHRLRPGEVCEQYLWDQRLLPLLGYLTADQTVKVKEALSLAYDAHAGQKRKSGEPFITHPVEVTRILAELKMDYECLVAGLLHDTVEDCSDVIGLDEIEFYFGRNVRRIVEGETKFCKLPSHLSASRSSVSGSRGGSDSEGEQYLPLPGLGRGLRAAAGGSGSSFGGSLANGANGANGAGPAASYTRASESSSDWPSDYPSPGANGASSSGSFSGPEGGSCRSDGGAAAEQQVEEGESLRPLPSTFSEAGEMGRQPLMDLVLSTPGNDKPSRAQDIQFLFLAMTEEWRIIVVKLADRLHNMRTMGSMPQGKARNIANETLEVFGPLARLLGLYSIKEELEELAFKYANPSAYDLMKREVGKLWHDQQPVVEAACAELRERLAQDPYLRERVRGVRVEPSRKALYSCWKKLDEVGKTAKDVSDIAQLRVVIEPAAPGGVASLDYTNDRQLCYHVMGLVHSFWAPIPGTMKDYIATPKPNNYQSLHTTVVPTGIQLGPGQRRAAMFPIEVQIRTEGMNRVAELGIAVDTWAPPSPLPPVNGTPLANGALAKAAQGLNGSGTANGRLATPLSWAESLLQSFSLPPREEIPSVSAVAAAAAQQQQWQPPLGTAAQQQQQLGSKAGGGALQRLDPATMTRRINWLNSIRQWQEEFVGTLTAHEFIQCVTDDILGQGVFVFTPGGQIIRLPKGATVVDFAYHIHTQIGNTMAAAKVNSKLVQPEYELQNADVVEVVPYIGPVNANVLRKHQEWYRLARTKTARHKILRFLRENAALAASKGLVQLGGADSCLPDGCDPRAQSMWLVIQCDDRQGILAEVTQIIARHRFNIKSYSGSSDLDAASGVLNFVFVGDIAHLEAMCACLDAVPAVRQRAVGCELHEPVVPLKRRI